MPKSFRVGHVVNTFNELIKAIEDSIINPGEFMDQRQALCSKLFYKLDGKSAERGAEAIMNFAEDKGLI